jgi:hypothetical protein
VLTGAITVALWISLTILFLDLSMLQMKNLKKSK